MVQKLNDYCL
jgi:hypothetical protein